MLDVTKELWICVFGWLEKKMTKKMLISCSLTVFLLRIIREKYLQRCLQKKLSLKQKNVKKRIEQLRENLSQIPYPVDELLLLTKLNLIELQRRLASRNITPEKLLFAFQLKALQLYDSGNSGICEFILEANNWARVLVIENSTPYLDRSPLYGIPVSIKEELCVSKYDTTFGIIKRCGQMNKQDCDLVRVLKHHGAIPFVITCTSQASRSNYGANIVFGNSSNPYGKSRITGGSSVGEAVLLARRGSLIGFGNDLAGNIRIPAAFCGLACLKPTAHRLSSFGIASLVKNYCVYLKACPGPMSHRVNNLVVAMRTLLTPFMFDNDLNVVPLPFNEKMFQGRDKRQLRIGFYDNFDEPFLVQTVPSIRKAVRRAVAILQGAGHCVVRFTPPSPLRGIRLLLRAMFLDGGRELQSLLSLEPKSNDLYQFNLVAGLPLWMKVMGDKVLSLLGAKPSSIMYTLNGAHNAKVLLDLRTEIDDYRAEFQKAWNDAGPLDALICPASPYPAPPSNAQSIFVSQSFVYTGIYNILDYPAGTVPMGFVSHADEDESIKMPVNSHPNGFWYGSGVAEMQKGSFGLPLAVQVVSKPFREEIVLRIMEIIETLR